MSCLLWLYIFFFKQKTAYEMRISDWSSDVCSSDLNIEMRALPAPLQATLVNLQVGQTTQPFGAANEGVSVLVLCGRDMPQTATAPNLEQIEQKLLEEKVNKRAQRYLRDLRRDAVIEDRKSVG